MRALVHSRMELKKLCRKASEDEKKGMSEQHENLNHFIALNSKKMLERNEEVSPGTELCKDPFKLVKTCYSLGRIDWQKQSWIAYTHHCMNYTDWESHRKLECFHMIRTKKMDFSTPTWKKDVKSSKTLKRLSPGSSIVCWKVKRSVAVERFMTEEDHI